MARNGWRVVATRGEGGPAIRWGKDYPGKGHGSVTFNINRDMVADCVDDPIWPIRGKSYFWEISLYPNEESDAVPFESGGTDTAREAMVIVDESFELIERFY